MAFSITDLSLQTVVTTALCAAASLAILSGGTAAHAQQTAAAPSAPVPPAVRREFRGVWIATVSNIDWPSKPGLPVAQQKAELIALLDRAKRLNLNAIVFQVRPSSDAIYPSKLEPWSEYLTGQMGKAPEPFYDPLEMVVTESHKRGLELHAWFNPYRARTATATGTVSADHISKTRPDLSKQYGKSLWLDPGEPEVRKYSLDVVMDVVKRYDVDGVHIDDYFYPYKENGPDGKVLDFPDEPSYRKYTAGGGKLARNDWRRQNVDTFVQEMYQRVKAEKPWVKVGISPFGIWRPGNPAQIKGFDAYEELYADARKWWNQGWCDYFAPQLYWSIAQAPQSYPVLLSWWAGENTKGRHLWPGQYTSRASDAAGNTFRPEEIEYQINVTRGIDGRGAAGGTGTIHFSAKSLNADTYGMVGPRLLSTVYAEPALIPASPWLVPSGSKALAAPTALAATPGNGDYVPAVVNWKAGDAAPVWQWVVQAKKGNQWTNIVLPGTAPTACAVPSGAEYVSVYAVDRYGVAGAPAALPLATPAGAK